jgi:hypothetical protein
MCDVTTHVVRYYNINWSSTASGIALKANDDTASALHWPLLA